jgi:hypothetical protein
VIWRALGLAAVALAVSSGGCASRESQPAKVDPARSRAAPADEASDEPSVKECTAFTGKVNETLRKVLELTQRQSSSQSDLVSDMDELAATYDRLAVDIGALDLQSKTLEKYATEYREMCAKAASAARQVGNAVRTKNAKQAESAEKDFDKIVKQEDELVDRINRLCGLEKQPAS